MDTGKAQPSCGEGTAALRVLTGRFCFTLRKERGAEPETSEVAEGLQPSEVEGL